MHSVNGNEPLGSGETHLLSKVRFPSCRLVLMFMGFLGFVNLYCLRVSLSVALVAMLNHTQQPISANLYENYSETNFDDICVAHESIEAAEFGKEDKRSGEFNWDSHTQGTVLAAFYYGYITTQV